MSIAINNKKVKSIKIGNTNITKVYIGDKYVWPDYIFTASKTTFEIDTVTSFKEVFNIYSKVIRNGVAEDETFSIKQNGNFSTVIDSSDENAPSEDWVISVSENLGSERTDTIVLVQDNSGLTINITVTQIANNPSLAYRYRQHINAWYVKWNYNSSVGAYVANYSPLGYGVYDLSVTDGTFVHKTEVFSNSYIDFKFDNNTTGSYREEKLTITQQESGLQIFAIAGQFADLGLGDDAITELAIYRSEGYRPIVFSTKGYGTVDYTTIIVTITGGNTASYDFKLEEHYDSNTQNGFKIEPLTTLNSTTSSESQLVQVKATNLGYVEDEFGTISLYCKLKTDSDSSENWKECGRCLVAIRIPYQ